mgnify:FL=1|tara:strand:- start:409 stop:585 length:177 start_codon:yes stop_codon:yes gene_type:complete
MVTSSLSILFWVSVGIALFYSGSTKIVKKAKDNQFKDYEDTFCEACECDPCDCGFGSY